MVENLSEVEVPDNVKWDTRKQILAAWGGWLLDGYSTIAYLVVIFILAASMFPSSLGIWTLILTLGGVSLGAAARVAGSTVLGNYIGDKIGRKSLLTWSIVGFSVFTASIGLVPSYDSIGLFSPVLVYIVVIFAGVFAGAEYGGGASLAMESVPKEKRNIVGAFVQSGFGTGYFLVVLVALSLESFFGQANYDAYGWRWVFIIALIPGLLTLLIRYISHESPVFEEMHRKKEITRTPAKDMLKQRTFLLPAILMMTGLLFINQATFSFYPVLTGFVGITGNNYFYALLTINFISLIGVWTGGILFSNNLRRRNVMMILGVIFTVPSALYVYLGYSTSFVQFTVVFSIQAFFEAMMFSLLPAFLSLNFSKRSRSTAVGVSYNSGAVVGGLAVVILTLQKHVMDLKLAWSLDLYIAGIAMLLGLYFSVDRSTQKEDSINE